MKKSSYRSFTAFGSIMPKLIMVIMITVMVTVSGIAPVFYAYAEDDAASPAASEQMEESDSPVSDSSDPADSGNDDADDCGAGDDAADSEGGNDADNEDSNEGASGEDASGSFSAGCPALSGENSGGGSSDTYSVSPAADPDNDAAGNAAKRAAVPGKSAEAKKTQEEGDARIKDKVYMTVEEAVEAAVNGDVIEILRDIALSSSLVVDDKDITIRDDGSSRTITAAEGKSIPLIRVGKNAQVTLDGSASDNLKLRGGVSNTYNSASVAIVEGILSVKKVMIDGGELKSSYNGAITVRDGGLLDMSGGVIENTKIRSSESGAVLVREGGRFDMSGGIIRNNVNYSGNLYGGGGVMLNAWTGKYAIMNLSGGTITGNEARYGGGIFMTGLSKVFMTGGNIDGNYAREMGGGVCVSGLSGTGNYRGNEFIMDGGSISGNRARTGGGMYVNADGVFLNAGLMENNRASMLGGAIYVSEDPRVLHVSKAVITENKAAVGGGLWACPTGNIHLRVTDGVAVYNNTASSAGDDVVNLNNWYGGTTLTMPDRMLGGGYVDWYRDGGFYYGVSDYGSVNSSIARYDKEEPGEAQHFERRSGSHALKAVTSEAAISLANEEATLFIRNNSAWRGGGIGTNGDLTLARMDYEDWKLVTEKKWEGVADTDDKTVTVFLKIGEQVLDSVVLSKENGWKGEFAGLPDPRTLKDKIVTVVEGEMIVGEDGISRFAETSRYIVSYERVVLEDESVIYVTVINRPLPPPPEETKEEYKPEPPKTDESVLGDHQDDAVNEMTHTGIAAASGRGVDTGDETVMVYLVIIIVMAAAGIAAILNRRRKER